MPAVVVVVVAYAASSVVVGMIGVAALGIVGSIVVGAIVGAVVGGLTSAVMGGDVMEGAKMGGMAGAFAGGAAAYGEGASLWGDAGASQKSAALATGEVGGADAVATTGENVISSGGDLSAGGDLVGAANMPDSTGSALVDSGVSGGVEVGTAGSDVATAGTEVAKAGSDVAMAGGDAGMLSRVEALEAAGEATTSSLTMSDKLALGGSLLQGYGEGEAAKTAAEAEAALAEASKDKMQPGVDPRRATFTLGDSGPTKVQLETPVAQGTNIRRVAPVRRAGLLNQA